MSSASDFVRANLVMLGYKSKQDIIENLFIKSLQESYVRLDKTISNENDIRDRFMEDLYFKPSELRKWLQIKAIQLSWENWVFTPSGDKARTDISFRFSGMEYIMECKRLKFADKEYIEEGVERFVNLKYAKGDDQAAMVGFVINGDKVKIAKRLRYKIIPLDHTLTASEVSAIPRFDSRHKRVDNTQILLDHLFFDFQKK